MAHKDPYGLVPLGELGPVANEPFATSRASRRGGGFHLLLRLASGEPYAPVGRADEPTGGVSEIFRSSDFFRLSLKF